MRWSTWLGYLLAVLLLVGCAATSKDNYFSKQISTSSTEDTLPMEGLVIDAKQRLIWMPTSVSEKGTTRRLLCAEPSPDVMSALSSSFSAAVESNIAGKGDISADLQKSITESITNIGKRTATIQLLRDSLYRACEAYINGLIDEFGYALLLSKVDNLMIQLVSIEALEQPSSTSVNPEVTHNKNTRPQISRVQAIVDINNASHGESTIVGACMMYLAQREKTITVGHLKEGSASTPAIAHVCWTFLQAAMTDSERRGGSGADVAAAHGDR